MPEPQGGNGRDIPKCDLGNEDCPFARSIHWLREERETRIQTEGHLTVAIDETRDKAIALGKQWEGLDHDVRMLALDLRSHVKRHRWVEVLTLGIAMALGSAIAPAITALLAKLATR
jgi:hypothetical protein